LEPVLLVPSTCDMLMAAAGTPEANIASLRPRPQGNDRALAKRPPLPCLGSFRGWSKRRTQRFGLASQQGQTPLLSLLCLGPLSVERDLAIFSKSRRTGSCGSQGSLLSEEAVEEGEHLRSLVLLVCRHQQLMLYSIRKLILQLKSVVKPRLRQRISFWLTAIAASTDSMLCARVLRHARGEAGSVYSECQGADLSKPCVVRA
jgi:hypothetical protein